ncbi:MAG: TIGR00153 family protein [Thermoplasmata archaeon]|nr:TIGR00153 family protein [Thermoplasmata archaeon]
MTRYMRTPLASSMRRSPFNGLIAHAALVKKCAQPLRKAVEAYMAGDMETYREEAKRVMEIEGQADRIKNKIRKSLPKSIFMPVDKSTFLMLLREEDKILDYAEDVVVWLGMRETSLPPDIKKDFLALLTQIERTVSAYEAAAGRMGALVLSSFSKRETNHVIEHIHEVHRYEYEADQLNHRLSKKVFQAEDALGAMGVFHILKAINLLDQIADHAENAADRLRAMIAR